MKSVEYYNSKYMLERNEEERDLLQSSQYEIEGIKASNELPYCIAPSFEKYLKLRLSPPLYFTFGKYKGRIVQDIMETDPDYCGWLTNNIISNNLEILIIIDFINKNGERYTVENPHETLKQIFKNELGIEISNEFNQKLYKMSFNLYRQNSRRYNYYDDDPLEGNNCFDFYGHWDDYPEYH